MKNSFDEFPQISEVIIVEGRDDTAAIKRAVRAVTIETHGFGISKKNWEKIKNAYRDYGIIVFTDPDHAGEEIRRRILAECPEAKQAFLSREKAKATKAKAAKHSTEENVNGIDIGIENASPEDIRESLKKAHATILSPNDSLGRNDTRQEFSVEDIDAAGLSGGDGAKERREKIGDVLGIGYANAKGLLYKLNTLGIKKEEFQKALSKIDAK